MNQRKTTEINRTAGCFVMSFMLGLAITVSAPGVYAKEEPAKSASLKVAKADNTTSGAAGSATAGASAKMPEDPKAFFKQYHDALLAADSIEKVMPYLTEARIKQINGDKAKMPQKEFTMMFSFIKEMTPKRAEIVNTELGKAGDCTINLTAPSEDDPIFGGMVKAGKLKETTKGTVHLVKEGGSWKVEKESWKSSAISSDAETAGSPGDKPADSATAGNSGNPAPPPGFGGDCCSGAAPGATSQGEGAGPSADNSVSVKGGSMTVRPDNEAGKNGSVSK